MTRIPAREPSRPPAWDPNEERYWSPRDLEGELQRTFQVCHECRMCVTYCGSFPILFDAIDRQVESGKAEGAEALSAGTFQEVSDHCWQCKLCYIKCPYTPDEGARELLDFPRLMAREKAQRARRDGVALVDRILGEPQLIGRVTTGPLAPALNFVSSRRLVRKATERITGISSEFPLPPAAQESFTRWFERHRADPEAGKAGEVVLMPTCYGEYYFPSVARAAVSVLERNGFAVVLPQGWTCCGMPNLDGGDVELAKQKMARNVSALAAFVEAGRRVVVAGPTCSYTMKKEWPLYLGTAQAASVAGAVRDIMEFLDALRREGKLNERFMKGAGKVAYHAACHLRAQKVAIPGARVLARLPDTTVRVVERCSAVDGTWGMKAEFYEEGARYGARLARAMTSEEHDVLVGDCSLAGLRVHAENGERTLHPVQVLAEAYGIEPEPTGKGEP